MMVNLSPTSEEISEEITATPNQIDRFAELVSQLQLRQRPEQPQMSSMARNAIRSRDSDVRVGTATESIARRRLTDPPRFSTGDLEVRFRGIREEEDVTRPWFRTPIVTEEDIRPIRGETELSRELIQESALRDHLSVDPRHLWGTRTSSGAPFGRALTEARPAGYIDMYGCRVSVTEVPSPFHIENLEHFFGWKWIPNET